MNRRKTKRNNTETIGAVKRGRFDRHLISVLSGTVVNYPHKWG